MFVLSKEAFDFVRSFHDEAFDNAIVSHTEADGVHIDPAPGKNRDDIGDAFAFLITYALDDDYEATKTSDKLEDIWDQYFAGKGI
jgi:hypothetical protein